MSTAGGSHLELDGISYFVRDSGGAGDPVLLLHGAPDHGDLWRHQLRALSEAGYRAVCPDLLGYGESERAADGDRYRFDRMAADLVMLFQHLGLQPGTVHLIAHDFGASLGWILVGREPRWFRSYCAMSVGHPSAFLGQLDRERVRSQWNLFLNAHPDAAGLLQANDGALFKVLAASHPDVDAVFERFRDRAALEAMLDWERANHVPETIAAAFAGQLPADFAPRVTVPTLGIWSERDAYVWEEQMSGSGEFVDAEWRYLRLSGTGHWFMLEQPEETNTLLLEWLREGADARGEEPPDAPDGT